MNSYRTKDGRWFFFTGLEADRHIDSVLPRARPAGPASTTPASPTPGRCARTGPRSSPSSTTSWRSAPLAEWAERFDAEGVWWAPAQGPADVLEDPQLAANDGFLDLRNEARRDDRGGRSTARSSFSDLPVGPAAPAPLLGEHTDEVLAELAGARTGQANVERDGAAQS